MKKISALLIGLFLSFAGFSQSCLPEGIIFNTQAKIDSFQVNYPNCTQIEGNVDIGNSWIGSDITNLNGLSVLTQIGGYLVLYYNDSLTSLNGLSNLTSIGTSLEIKLNGALTNLTGLDNVAFIGNNIWISSNPSLTSLTALNKLTSIGGDLDIENNSILTSLAGLNNVTSIGGHLGLFDNRALTSLTALNNVTSIGGGLELDYNALTNLTGLENLTSIGGELWMHYNKGMTSLIGLDNLTSIGGFIQIEVNPDLSSLAGIDNVTSIGGYLYLKDNPVLSSLTGLDNIYASSITGLYIVNNISLSTCDVESVCDYLVSPNGTKEIHDNATGCNSREEVEAACKAGLSDNSSTNIITIFPNPASTIITISLPTTTPVDNTTLSIYNVNAQQVISRRIREPQTDIDISALPSGVYYARITNDRTVNVGKFIRQ
jgi:hypothetical protein